MTTKNNQKEIKENNTKLLIALTTLGIFLCLVLYLLLFSTINTLKESGRKSSEQITSLRYYTEASYRSVINELNKLQQEPVKLKDNYIDLTKEFNSEYLEIVTSKSRFRIYPCGQITKFNWKEIHPNEDYITLGNADIWFSYSQTDEQPEN